MGLRLYIFVKQHLIGFKTSNLALVNIRHDLSIFVNQVFHKIVIRTHFVLLLVITINQCFYLFQRK